MVECSDKAVYDLLNLRVPPLGYEVAISVTLSDIKIAATRLLAVLIKLLPSHACSGNTPGSQPASHFSSPTPPDMVGRQILHMLLG